MRGVVESSLQLEPHLHLIILSFLEMTCNNRHNGKVEVEPNIKMSVGDDGGKRLWRFGGRCALMSGCGLGWATIIDIAIVFMM